MKQIPLFKVFISPNIDTPLLDVIHSGFIGEGESVKLFEKNLGIFLNNTNNLYIITLSSNFIYIFHYIIIY